MATRKKKKKATGKMKAGYPRPRPGPVTLEAFLHGQRQINGSFYEILDKVFDALDAVSKALSVAPGGPLAAAKKLVENVPGIDPPGCEPPPPPPPGG